jgi:hypothetical protein
MKVLKTVALTICLVFFLSSFALAQRAKSVVLPEKEAKRITDQCSRETPSEVTGTWTPSPEDIKKMEAKLSDIKNLRAKCCIKGQQIEDPEQYYMQYAGIISNGKKLIYINAFDGPEPGISKFWKERSVMICDGGVTAWGVLYDPAKGIFFDLSVNGLA